MKRLTEFSLKPHASQGELSFELTRFKRFGGIREEPDKHTDRLHPIALRYQLLTDVKTNNFEPGQRSS